MNSEFNFYSRSLDPNTSFPEKFIFNGQGCSGENLSPELEWAGAPDETRSYAITVIDPDTPSGKVWRHWTVINIPAAVLSLPEGASSQGLLPLQATEIENDFGIKEYGGPCPPSGDRPHRYIFTIYAIKTEMLKISPHADRETVEASLEENSLGKTSFTISYGRQKH